MPTSFNPIQLTLRTVKNQPLTFLEGDNNLSSIKFFCDDAKFAINNTEQQIENLQQTIVVTNQNVASLQTNYGTLSSRVATLEGYDAATRLTNLESYIPSITTLSSTVSTHTTKISFLEDYSMLYSGDAIGGASNSVPTVLNSLPNYSNHSCFYVSFSGWFSTTDEPTARFVDQGDLIVVDGLGFKILKTSESTIESGSTYVDVLKKQNNSGNVEDSTVERGWVVDLSSDTKSKITYSTEQVDSLNSRVGELESKVASPFNYRGSVAGGTQVAPFDLETLTNKANGDFYRVSSSGYFVDVFSTVYKLNANDSFVFSNSAIEKFDNTDTTVSGGSAYVSVTGNTDDGYSVDLAQTTKDSIDSISGLSSTVSGHTTQIGDLETDVADHETRIATLESTSTTLLYATKASGRASFTTTDPDQIVDSFDSTVLKTAKYVAQAELADGTMHASEILVTNNGTTVYITEYAKLNGGTDLVTYTADFNGTLVELYATPANANTTITFARTAVKKV